MGAGELMRQRPGKAVPDGWRGGCASGVGGGGAGQWRGPRPGRAPLWPERRPAGPWGGGAELRKPGHHGWVAAWGCVYCASAQREDPTAWPCTHPTDSGMAWRMVAAVHLKFRERLQV